MQKKYDGCSGYMSIGWRFCFKKDPPWEGCCDKHDQPYAKGGTAAERKAADVALLRCVVDTGHPWWAVVMYIGVRMGGVPWLPTPWRWGFDVYWWNVDAWWYTKVSWLLPVWLLGWLNPVSWWYQQKKTT